jgi:hypothetical protein
MPGPGLEARPVTRNRRIPSVGTVRASCEAVTATVRRYPYTCRWAAVATVAVLASLAQQVLA